MAHAIDTTNGVGSFADSRADQFGRVDAWHKLGQAVGHAMTADEALDAAHMRGWDVRKVPLIAFVPGGDDQGAMSVPVAGKYLTMRTNPQTSLAEPLGVVGERWTPFQNEATTALLGDITEASGGHIETLGALDGGRRTFVTMLMPNWMEFTVPHMVEPTTGKRLVDRTDLYLSIFNRHDGEGSLVAQISPVRVVCANTQRLAEQLAVSRVALRHTGDPRARMAEVRNLLGLTFTFRETYVEQCEALIAKQVDPVQVLDVIEDVWRVKGAQTEAQEKSRKATAASVFEVYQTSPTVKAFYGTGYGAYNAITEYLDHFAPVKQAEGEDAAIKRAQRTLMSTDQAALKASAFTALALI